MDSFELNKIIGAILGTLLFVMGIGFLAAGIYAPITNNGPGYTLPKPKATTTAAAKAAPPVTPLPVLLASASAAEGAKQVKKCEACHDFTDGGPNKVGPNLYGVVDRPIASHPGYSYSDALKKHSGEKWTYAHLNIWLTSPKAWAPGTKMTFIGIEDPKDRADVLAYLQTLAKTPVPFPKPTAKAKPAAPKAAGPAQAKPSAGAEPAPAASTTPAGSTTAPASSNAKAAPAANGASSAAPAASTGTTAPSTPAPASNAAAPASNAGGAAAPATTTPAQ